MSYIKKIQEFIKINNIEILQSKELYKDFSVMLNSDILIFLHGTLSWWAGYLGRQKKVFVSSNWRPIKNYNPLLSNYSSSRWEKW